MALQIVVHQPEQPDWSPLSNRPFFLDASLNFLQSRLIHPDCQLLRASPTKEVPLSNDEAGVGEVSTGTLDSSRSGCNRRLESVGQLVSRGFVFGID
ncbi:hypothetical protein OUZ56_017298 [Daphnia magna]|uniref:Uncharacterized protein n=1 Tax=Daphnia magna TaxID=35525 RepID=A0ABR0AST9_9CRUS|nr:hypothetical protein OUZ56_017298 [Daphnia magna]